MSTICPNCLRPVRSEARFCGYCGTNLNPAALDEVSAALPPAQPQASEAVNDAVLPPPRSRPDGEKIRRTVLIVIVILLILVLMAAFLIQYWPAIGSYFGALITVLRTKAPY